MENTNRSEEERNTMGVLTANKRGKEVGYLSLLGDIQKVVPCSDADKPVGSCGAWRGVCYNRKRQVCTCFYIYTHTKLTLVVLLLMYY